MSKKSIRSIAIIAILALISFFIAKRAGLFDPEKPDPVGASGGPSGASALAVKTHILQPETLAEELSITGTLFPAEEVELTCEVSGKITQIHFKEGNQVRSGQLLLKVDDKALQAQLTKVKFQQQLAQQKEQRKKKLLEIGGISQEEYDQALTEFNTLEADKELLNVQISKTEIRAPFGGTIGLRQVSKGSYLTPGTRIATLVNLNPIKLEFSVPEKYANRAFSQAEVRFRVEGIDSTFVGKVYAREPEIDAETRSLLLKARCPNPQRLLLPGAFARIDIVLGTFEDALMIPTEAVVPQQAGQSVYVYRNGIAVSTPITIGIRQAATLQVTKGLTAGDTVITSGLMQIRPGSAVAMEEGK